MNSTVLALKRISGLRYVLTLTAAALAFCGSASATLLDRGSDMVYDDVLNITWTRQAGDGVRRSWPNASGWADGLVFGGFDDWRLPYASVSAGAGPTAVVYSCTGAGGPDEVACRDNEMAYMYWYNLPGSPFSNKTGNQTAVGGQMLADIQFVYWSGTEFGSLNAWTFDFDSGFPVVGGVIFSSAFAWAVRPGDVAAVPEPASLLLIGVGLAGLGFRRRKLAS